MFILRSILFRGNDNRICEKICKDIITYVWRACKTSMKADSQQQQPPAEDGAYNPPGKMFIGGLNWQTTPDALQTYFDKYGEILECMIMRDPVTRRSRGFGFVTFANPTSVDKVLAAGIHQLDAKVIDPKVAFPRRSNGAGGQPKLVTRTKKLFVGGLSASTTVDDVRAYFQQFGKVEDAMLMFDKVTQRHRGQYIIEWSVKWSVSDHSVNSPGH